MKRKAGLSGWQHFRVFTQGLPTDAKLTRERRFLLAGTSTAAQFDNLAVHQRFVETSVGAALLDQCDCSTLPLSDPAPMTDSSELAIVESSPTKLSHSLTDSIRIPRLVNV